MTKEEFEAIISNELDKLEKEYKEANEKFLYFDATAPLSQGYREAKHQKNVLSQKIGYLRNIVALPAYARIRAMSDSEIEEYKKERINEINLEIKAKEAEKKQEETKRSQLESEQSKCIDIYSDPNASHSEKVEAISHGRNVNDEINRCEMRLKEIEKEKKVLQQEIEETEAMTAQKIKQQLLSKINNGYFISRAIKEAEAPIEEFTELQALVAGDYAKSKWLADKMQYYNHLSSSKRNILSDADLELDRLPGLLREKLELSSDYDEDKKTIRHHDKVMEIVEDFEKYFQQQKAVFNEQFTEEKLMELAKDPPKYDMHFLQLHSDKMGAGDLECLETLVEQKNKLSKKRIKTKIIKLRISQLDYDIEQELNRVYKKIIGWYMTQCAGWPRYRGYRSSNLGMTYNLQFTDVDSLKFTLDQCREDVNKAEIAIKKTKEIIKEAKEKYEQAKQVYDNKMSKTAQEIRALGGEKYNATKIGYVADNEQDNFHEIASASGMMHQRDLVNKTLQEAQRQAIQEEARLRGVTVEQLLQMKEQEKINESGSRSGGSRK